MPALQNDADGAHMRKAAAFFPDERGDFLRQPQIVAVQIDVVGHQRLARADGRRTRAWMKDGFADIRRVATNGHLFRQGLIAAATDIRKLFTPRNERRFAVEINRNAKELI